MAEFIYEGLRDGKRVKGKLLAESRREALSRLKSEGIIPVDIREESKKVSLLRREFHLKKPSEEDIAFVLLQIGVLLESGITLARSLELVASQIEDQRISGALLSVKGEVERGESLSSAFRRSGIFPDFFPEMLTAAETGENLEKIFQIAGEHLETIAQMKGKILNAVVYPAVVITFSVVALFIAIKFVVPRIASVLEGLGRELPLITRAVILLSDLLSILFWILPLFLLLFLFRRRFLSPEKVDRFIGALPGIGKIRDYFDYSRFAYSLYITLSSAVPITRAYDISAGSVSSYTLRKKLRDLRDRLEKGESLNSILRHTERFPSLFVNLVETGENSGELERMLKLLAEIYRRESLRMINLWIRLIEPISILIIGVVVGIIVVSVLLPLTEITSGINR